MTARTILKGCFGSVVAYSLESNSCRRCEMRTDCQAEVQAREVRVLKHMKTEIERLRQARKPNLDVIDNLIEGAKTAARAFIARRQ